MKAGGRFREEPPVLFLKIPRRAFRREPGGTETRGNAAPKFVKIRVYSRLKTFFNFR